MPVMSHRTTFALDKATAKRLKRLAALWRVSQAEVVRRSVAQAEATAMAAKPDPLTLLRDLHAAGHGVDSAEASTYLRELREDRVICLDTNYLILGLVEGTSEARSLVEWTQSREALITPMPAWFEFLCGPVTQVQVATMRAFLHEVVAFGEPQALEAVRLFNAVGRKRTLRVDSMIAGSAVAAGARLATNNRRDFEVFAPHGLQLV
jgi:predicted nucleic acid-binding protein/predicted transcriptional regulator